MDYLSQLKKNIRIGNTADAKNLLARLHDRNEAEKQEAIQAIALSPDKTAFELLSFLTLDGQKDPQINERLIQLVIDRAHLTFKFVLILFENTSSKTLRHIVPLLKHILSSETDRKVLSAVIRAAGKNRLDQMVDDLAEFIFFDDTHLKADAVKALERIGSSGALENLIKASKTDKCDPDILDAIEVLKKEPASRKDRPGKSGILKKTAGSPGLPDLGSPNVRTLLDALKSSPESRLDLPCALADSDITLHHDALINLLWLVQRTVPLDAVNVLFDLLKKKGFDTHG